MKENALDITEQSEVFEFKSIGDIINQTLQKSKNIEFAKNGLSTGFLEIDKEISGLQKGHLITVAVKPGMGKTAFLLSMTNNIAIKNNNSVAIFSFERSNQKITNRLIESETGMSVGKLKDMKMRLSDKDHLNTLISNIAKAKIFLDDTQSLSIEDLYEKARQLKILHDVDLIIIDYLELLSIKTAGIESREEELSTKVHSLKDIAKELNLPVVLFSQLQGYGFGQNMLLKPSIKDIPIFLSELSDVIMFLHRANFMNNSSKEVENVNMIIAKSNNQNQNTIIPLKYIESIAKFVNS